MAFGSHFALFLMVVLVIAGVVKSGSKDDIDCENLDMKVACSNYDTIEKCGILDECMKGDHFKDMFKGFDKDFNDDGDDEEDEEDGEDDYNDEL